MLTIPVKPLSVNDAYRGRRFKSADYERYARDINLLIPDGVIMTGELEFRAIFYIKNYTRRDVDNMIKPLWDILKFKGYFEDDSQIKRMVVEKARAEKEEYIECELKPY